MDLDSDGEVNTLPCRNLYPGKTPGPISSLNETRLHTLDSCVLDTPSSEVILMCNCFFGGAMYAVHLLQNGHGDQLVSEIAGSSRNICSYDSQSPISTALTRVSRHGTMDPKEFVKHWSASRAADNKPKRDVDTEQSYCANVSFSTDIFKA